MASLVEEFNDLERLKKEFEYLQTHAVKVGILDDGSGKKRDRAKAQRKLMKRKGLIKKGGTGKKSESKGKGATVLEYAIFNEYGTSRIPKRPFFRLSVGTKKAQNEIKEYLNTQIENIISGELTGQEAYDNLGTFVVQKIKKTIMSGNFAPLDSKTIKRKGSSTPLIDTHSLYNSISYEIVGV
jgi:phage protein